MDYIILSCYNRDLFLRTHMLDALPHFQPPDLGPEILDRFNTQDMRNIVEPAWTTLHAMGPVINGIRRDMGLPEKPYDNTGFITRTLTGCPADLIPVVARRVYEKLLDPLLQEDIRQQSLLHKERDADGMVLWHTNMPRPVSLINTDAYGKIFAAYPPDHEDLFQQQVDDLVFTNVADTLNRGVGFGLLDRPVSTNFAKEAASLLTEPVDEDSIIIIQPSTFSRYVGRIDHGVATLIFQTSVYDQIRGQQVLHDFGTYNAMSQNLQKLFLAVEATSHRETIPWEEALKAVRSETEQESELTDLNVDNRVNRELFRYLKNLKSRREWLDVMKLFSGDPEEFFLKERETVCGPDVTSKEVSEWETQREVLLDEIRRQRKMKGVPSIPPNTDGTIFMN